MNQIQWNNRVIGVHAKVLMFYFYYYEPVNFYSMITV